jgi:aminoglycoside phosphotransferase (APT) family kinase protein
MGREHKIIAALGPTAVPVAPALGYCDDPAVNGAAFYIMEFVPGEVIHDATIAEKALDEKGRRRLGEQLIDVLAALHAIDPDAVGLGDLGRKEGFIERQLKRWYGQWEKSKTRELPEIDEVYHHLVTRIPDQGPAGIVHGDYRAGNCITGPDGTLRAVLDWELCTLGDVLADVGYFAMGWTGPGEEQSRAAPSPSSVPGFPSRDELLARYAAKSGRSLANIDFYVAFSSWKLACIVEGVYARYLHGAMGSGKSGFEMFKQQVERCAAQAAQVCARIA